MVPDVATGDFMRMFCLNCARRTVSPKSVSKYDGLAGYLKFRAAFTNLVKLTFAKIDGIIGDNLPMSAYKTEKWWCNAPVNVHAKAWLDAGWNVQEANLKEGYVIFKKTKDIQTKSFRRKTSRNKVKKPFTPVRIHILKSNKPSKTRASKLYARLKNLERQRASMPTYHGSFKPKSKYEKKLFKPEKKPQ
jgi:hypothetical protein